jgi:hypothetical protein
MIKPLTRRTNTATNWEINHLRCDVPKAGCELTGDLSGIHGNVTNVRGDATNITGQIDNIYGDVSNLIGDISGLTGCVSFVSGNATGMVGDCTGLNGGDWQLLGEFVEVESGKRNDRPKLQAALDRCAMTGATLVIAKLDRLARNVAFISKLMESGVDFVAVDFPTANRLTVHILAAVAEHEGKMISERTKSALNLRDSVIEFVLSELPDQSYVPGSVTVASPGFKILLEDFEFASPRGEPSGAAFQGAVFGFIRADNPHLQVEIDKVRTGSSRLQRVGDIDGWDGERLAITAEVKSLIITEEAVQDLAGFANKANIRGAIGLVVALSFSGRSRDMITDLGMICLDKNELTGIVRLWDPSKQRIAVESVVYYAAHVEKNSILLSRLKEFIASQVP